MAIRSLGEEICQNCNPYANIAQRGILHAQLNSILTMFSHIKMDNDISILCGAKELRKGYILLHMCEETTKSVTEAKANTILKYWGEMGWPNLNGWN